MNSITATSSDISNSNTASSAAGNIAINSIDRPRQNWVLSPLQDSLLVIVAPLITLAMALVSLRWFGSVKGATIILISHVVFTVAHHLPTFIRVYGDIELFRRYRWHFICAPLISLTCCLSVLGYLNLNEYPLENFMFLYILLTLWDPWHFMRQHYGFMRIYDRVSAAPPAIATRMDFLLSISWFAYIMVASGDWMFDLLHDMYTRTEWPLLMMLTQNGVHTLTVILRLLAWSMSAAYLGYVMWCWKKRYAVSVPKLLMCLTTFGVMYLTYTPNSVIQSIAPGWTFKVGFAVIGIVHVSQYLAIVWRYNRKLTMRDDRARTGVFRWIHSRGTWWAAGIYVVACLVYGDVITTVHNNAWLMSLLLAVGFTSTMMHYYFDGFIWKIHHTQNQEMLVTTTLAESSPIEGTSWWSGKSSTSGWKVLAKQMAYFAVPMTVLTFASFPTWSHRGDTYITHMYHAQELNQQGFGNAAEQEARTAYQLMRSQLPLAAKLVELEPSASRRADLAFLIYNESLYENVVMPVLDGQSPTNERIAKHHEATRSAIAVMNQAIASGESLAHAGRETFNARDAQHIVASWQKQVG